MQAAAAGQVYATEGFAPLRNLADYQARTNLQQGELLAARTAATGMTNQQFAQQAAINTVGRVADAAVAAQAMEQEGFLDKTFNKLSAPQQAIVRAHGYSEDASAVAKMNALFGATQNYAQWGVHDGYRHSVSFAANSGEYGDDVWRQNRGLFKEAGYYLDNVGQISYAAIGGQNVAMQEVYASVAGGVKDAGDLVGIKSIIGRATKKAAKSYARNATKEARRTWFHNTREHMREIRRGGGRDKVPESEPDVVLTDFPE